MTVVKPSSTEGPDLGLLTGTSLNPRRLSLLSRCLEIPVSLESSARFTLSNEKSGSRFFICSKACAIIVDKSLLILSSIIPP